MNEPSLVFVVPVKKEEPLSPVSGLSRFFVLSSFLLALFGSFCLVLGVLFLLSLFVIHAFGWEYGTVDLPLVLSVLMQELLPLVYQVFSPVFGEMMPFPMASLVFFIALMIFWVLLLTPQMVVHFLLLYRAWACLMPLKKRWKQEGLEQSEEYREFLEPKEVVGLLFVPGFQLYWSFPAYQRLPYYGRKYSQFLGVAYAGPNEKVSFWYPIFCLASAFLGVSILFLPIFLMILNQKFNALIVSVAEGERLKQGAE